MATKLRVVSPEQPGIKPGRKLGRHGLDLWKSILQGYDIQDAGGIEMLLLACQALDRAESMRAQIDRDGEITRGKNGLRDNPLLRHELQARAFVVRTLSKLGLDVEAIKPIGRPPPPGWPWDGS